jgi:two-component system chemotaxis response regulator CheY
MRGNIISQAGELAGALLPSEASPPRSILVVEDDPDIRRINAMVLHRAGYHVDTAEDGAFAWEMLGVSDYDLMVTDNNMPNLTGMELLKRLYATRMILPFIMATGIMPEVEFTQCPWLQPAARLFKPYSVEELLGAVTKVLRETDDAATDSQVFRGQDLKVNKNPQAGELASARVQCRTSPPRRILVVED